MKRNFTLLVLAVAFGFSAAAQDQGPVFSPASGSEGQSASAATTGIEQIENETKVNIYSFNDQIYVQADVKGTVKGTAKVYDLTGRLVLTQRINSTQNIISSEEFNSSYYIVAVELEGKTFTSRVFVK